jgi:hypothetical protein
MKTSKTSGKSGKTSKNIKEVQSNNIAISNFRIDEEKIREKARDIYYQRIERGENGTPEDDWLEAEASLRDSE